MSGWSTWKAAIQKTNATTKYSNPYRPNQKVGQFYIQFIRFVKGWKKFIFSKPIIISRVFNLFLIDIFKKLAILSNNSYSGKNQMTPIPASLLISISLMAMMMAMVMRRRIQQAALARRRVE